MDRFRLLARVAVKTSWGKSESFFSKKLKKKDGGRSSLYTLLMVVLFSSLFIAIGGMGHESFKAIQGQLTAMRSTAASMMGTAMIYGILLAIISLPSTYFYSDELESYLAMPLSGLEISASRLLSLASVVYPICLLLYVPVAVGALMVDFSFSSLLGWLVNSLLFPLYPTVLVSFLALLLLWIFPFLRKRRLLDIMAGLSTFLLAISSSISGTIVGSSGGTEITIGGALYSRLPYLFLPVQGSPLLIYSQGAADILKGLGLLIGPTALLLALSLWVGKESYSSIALSIRASQGQRRRRKRSREERRETLGKAKSPLSSLIRREFKNLFSRSANLLNVVLLSLIYPLLLVVLFFIGFYADKEGEGIAVGSVRNLLFVIISDLRANDLSTLCIGAAGIGAVVGLFCSLSPCSATAFSRDARHIDFLKSIPLSAHTILLSKLLPGIIMQEGVAIFLFLLSLIVVPLDLLVYLLLIFGSLLAILAMNEMEILLDLLSPKLDWEDEAMALKGKNVTISYFMGMILFFSMFILVVRNNLSLSQGLLGLLILLMVIAAVLWLYLRQAAPKALAKMQGR